MKKVRVTRENHEKIIIVKARPNVTISYRKHDTPKSQMENKIIFYFQATFDYMLEANGADSNGGIFSLPVDFTLLNCAPKDKKPVLQKKFGSWDENTENFLKHPVTAGSKNGIFLAASPSDVTKVF